MFPKAHTKRMVVVMDHKLALQLTVHLLIIRHCVVRADR